MTNWLNKTHVGDCRDVIPRMIADGVQVQTVVTSPPYWGLRDYRVEGQIGLEPTLQEWMTTMVNVFRSVRDVLKSDGTMWLNMGDAYAGSWGAQSRKHAGKHAPNVSALSANQVKAAQIQQSRTGSLSRVPGLKAKDLIGLPWRLAFALQDDGWYLRSDIIWSKPNPMPESITDRPTKAHEYIFLLSKSRRYYYDAAAIREPVGPDTHARMRRARSAGYAPEGGGEVQLGSALGPRENQNRQGVNPKAVGRRIPVGWDTSRGDSGHRDKIGRYKNNGVGFGHGYDEQPKDRVKQNDSFSAAISGDLVDYRNKRSVWIVPTEGFSGGHFATFPQELIKPCVLAGSPAGGIVFDPFMGSGTTAQVATNLGRSFIGIELNPTYIKLHDMRRTTTGMQF